jgi:hypothetical protein
MEFHVDLPIRIPAYDGRFAVMERTVSELTDALAALQQKVADAAARDRAEDDAFAAKIADLTGQLDGLRTQLEAARVGPEVFATIEGIEAAVDDLDKPAAEPPAADAGTGTGAPVATQPADGTAPATGPTPAEGTAPGADAGATPADGGAPGTAG